MEIDIKPPEKMELLHHGSHIEIIRKWFSRNFVYIALVAIFVIGLIWPIFEDFAKPGAIELLLNGPFPFNLVIVVFGVAGAALTYYALAGLLNRTHISVSREKFVVRHGPVPWLGNTELESGNLKSLYVKIKSSSNKSLASSQYEVHALTVNGKAIKLVSGLAMTSVQASYLKQVIENYLGIKDALPAGINPKTEEKMTFSHRGTDLEIVMRWFDDRTVGWTVFSIVWLGFISWFSWSWATMSRSRPLLPLDLDIALNYAPFLIMFILFGVGIFYAYESAAKWLNRTYIVVNREYFSVRHGPLPWPGNLNGAAGQIKRLHTKVSRWSSGNGQYRRYTYNVLADRQDGKSMKIAGGFESASQAMKVAQEMAKYLGLKPDQGAPQSVPVSDDPYTHVETALTTRQGHQAVTGSSNPEQKAVSQRGNSRVVLGLGLIGLFGITLTVAGLYFIASVVGLNEQGYSVAHQLIRFLVGATFLSMGSLFLGSAFRILSDRVAIYLFVACFILFIAMFVLIAIFGTGFSVPTKMRMR